MSGANNIVYLANDRIDKTKWDDCISGAGNGLIYGYSFYLDTMARHWDGLVLNDYEAIMPLTWNKKYGFYYLYQPFLSAQLGVFGRAVTEKNCQDLIRAIPNKFRFIDISLNSGHISGIPSGYSQLRLNHLLDLNKPYDQLYKNYSENIQRNIKKALQNGCTVIKDFAVEKVIELAMLQMKEHGRETSDNINRFRKLYPVLHQKQMAITCGITSSQNKLLASAVFFYSHKRAYYILVGNHPDGKTSGASHALIDSFIKDHAGKDLLLDFEGSDIPSLALFYKGFGATEIVYPQLKINRLPFYLKWIKK